MNTPAKPTTPASIATPRAPSPEAIAHIEDAWRDRCNKQRIPKGTEKYRKAEAAYFAGAQQTLMATHDGYVHVAWGKQMALGLDIIEDLTIPAPNTANGTITTPASATAAR